MASRPTWEEYFRDITRLTSSRSPCKRLHVDVYLSKIIELLPKDITYLPGAPHEQVMRDGHEIATIHAEQNVITDCAKRGVSCIGATAYISHYPCKLCQTAICWWDQRN